MTLQFTHTSPIYPHSFFAEENEHWCIDSEKSVLKNGQFFTNLPEGIIFSGDFPLFRKVSQDVFVLVEDCNAWLFNTDGQVIKHFSIGKGAWKIHTQAGKIIIGYGVGCYEHGEHRLAIFNQEGALEYVFHDLGTEITSIFLKEANSILVQSYGLNSIVEIDLLNFSQKHYYCPKILQEYMLKAMYYQNGMAYLAIETEPYPIDHNFENYEISIFKMPLSVQAVDCEFAQTIRYNFFVKTTTKGFIFHNFVLQQNTNTIWLLNL